MPGKACSQYIMANKLRLHYLEWDAKKKPVMLLLHGTGDDAHIWQDFVLFAARDFRVIALDQRGHGKSDWARPAAYSCKDYVGDIAAVINGLKLTKIILIGHSMGALHATTFAAEHPEFVSALVHVDINPKPPEWNRDYLHGLFDTLPRTYSCVKDYSKILGKASPYAAEKTLFNLAAQALEKKQDSKFYRRCDLEVFHHFDQYNLDSILEKISCPTLIVRGTESKVMSKKAAREMEKKIITSRLVEIPRATHSVLTDAPDKFQKAVEKFISEEL